MLTCNLCTCLCVCLCYCRDGQAVTLPPVSNRRVADFGKGIGRRSVYLYNLPEVSSGHQIFGVPSISARFGTAPDPWNWAMWLLARLVPRSECMHAELFSLDRSGGVACT